MSSSSARWMIALSRAVDSASIELGAVSAVACGKATAETADPYCLLTLIKMYCSWRSASSATAAGHGRPAPEQPTGTLMVPTGTLMVPTGTLMVPTGTLMVPTGTLTVQSVLLVAAPKRFACAVPPSGKHVRCSSQGAIAFPQGPCGQAWTEPSAGNARVASTEKPLAPQPGPVGEPAESSHT
jgi:hypothetical protein